MTVLSTSSDATVDLLKAKAMLLLRTERELLEFRLARDRVATWLEVFHSLSAMLGVTDETAIVSKSADMLIDHLGFETVTVYRHRTGDDEIVPICVHPRERQAHPMPEIAGDDPFLSIAHGNHEESDASICDRIGQATGLEKYFWLSFPVGKDTHHLLVAGFSANSAEFHSLSGSDAGHFLMFGNHLAALLRNSELVAEVRSEQRDLRASNAVLDDSLRELRKTQEELVRSTRLASVGEMAGRVAHEVLNPVTSIQGRLARMLQQQNDVYTENVSVLIDILTGWKTSYDEGGFEALVQSLADVVDDGSGGQHNLLEDDLANLASLHDYFIAAGDSNTEGLEFLSREADRVTRIVDGMRSLTRQSGSTEQNELAGVLRESGEALYDGFSKRNVTLDISCPTGLEVLLDRYELIQVLTNLMRNSLMAIEEGVGREGGGIRLEGSRRSDGWIEIRVIDSGTGISEEHLPYLFESDFTTRSAKDGTGLGLSISKRLVRGFGGELSVEKTEIGVGSTFLIELPPLPASEDTVADPHCQPVVTPSDTDAVASLATPEARY